MAAKRKLVRRFEPRYGVSEQMLEAESVYVGREREDYQILSTNDLKEKLATVGQMYRRATAGVEAMIPSLLERDALAIRCLVVRYLYLILELYCKHLNAKPDPDHATASPKVDGTNKIDNSKAPVLPFTEWLFERC